MTAPPLTPLEPWIKGKAGIPAQGPLTRKALARHQLRKLNQTLEFARGHSPFYREHLRGWPEKPLTDLAQVAGLPFTCAEDLRQRHLQMLTVSRGRVAGVFTLPTSGTTAPPKRLHFTEGDLELTADFFQHGMSTLVGPGDKVLILMPGPKPGSIADLLKKGLARLGARGILHWPLAGAKQAVEAVTGLGVDALVGLPVPILGLCRHELGGRLGRGVIKSVLLSADYVPCSVVSELEGVWGCRVFEHYGMTEMGYGGGVHCAARQGYHLREADLLFEVVDPQTGEPLPKGETGEVVFTTLTRRGMPLIRYRTGDISRFIPEPCPCGSMLARLGKVKGRLNGEVSLGGGHSLGMAQLDETLLAVRGVMNTRAELRPGEKRPRLCVAVDADQWDEDMRRSLNQSLAAMPAVAGAAAAGLLDVEGVKRKRLDLPQDTMTKRRIVDHRARAAAAGEGS